MSTLELVSFEACPFVQRAAIMLEEQGREYEITYIDLWNKPDWFLKISPSGKVPVLKVDDTSLFESVVILEYLDETTEEGKLLPEDALQRASHRMWITFVSTIMTKAWQLQAATEEEAARKLAVELRGYFQELSQNLSDGGPYWGGKSYTMVDAAIAPIMQRLTWAETLEPSLGLFDGLPKVSAWRDSLLARPSTTTSIVPDLEQRSGRMLKTLGSWLARGFEEQAS